MHNIRPVQSVTLAPMEGVVDHLMRQLLTAQGGYDLCVTEFVRVVDRCLPERVMYRLCPELQHSGELQGRTFSGTPVRVQLLGNHPDYLAENALLASQLGSQGIDLNFGCPAKTVNRSKGGAVLLREPETLFRIVQRVRETLPAEQALSAKIRLGYDDSQLFEENVQAICEAGANSLAIHARTRAQGYKAPAHWHYIARLHQNSHLNPQQIPIVANGEIWNARDVQACMTAANTGHVMLGRGALAVPNLAQVIRNNAIALPWAKVCQLLCQYASLEIAGDKGLYFPNRIKQWLRYLKLHYVEAGQLFAQIRSHKQAQQILPYLHEQMGHQHLMPHRSKDPVHGANHMTGAEHD